MKKKYEPHTPVVYGYCRISTKKQLEQNGLDAQESEIKEKYPSAVIIREQGSGQSKRKKIEGLLEQLQEGDTLVCVKLDRFCRSTEEGLKNINIPTSVTNIGVSAFNNCDALTTITIPNSIMTLDQEAFRGCDNLTTITIPSGTIGNYAFEGCVSLKSVNIGSNVTSIGKYVFNECTSLKSIYFANPYYWYASGQKISVTNSSTNVTYFTSTYINKEWIRKNN